MRVKTTVILAIGIGAGYLVRKYEERKATEKILFNQILYGSSKVDDKESEVDSQNGMKEK